MAFFSLCVCVCVILSRLHCSLDYSCRCCRLRISHWITLIQSLFSLWKNLCEFLYMIPYQRHETSQPNVHGESLLVRSTWSFHWLFYLVVNDAIRFSFFYSTIHMSFFLFPLSIYLKNIWHGCFSLFRYIFVNSSVAMHFDIVFFSITSNITKHQTHSHTQSIQKTLTKWKRPSVFTLSESLVAKNSFHLYSCEIYWNPGLFTLYRARGNI